MEEFTFPVISLIIQHKNDSGRILLQERIKPETHNLLIYELPQGRIRKNELLINSAKRELNEETGLYNFHPSVDISTKTISGEVMQYFNGFIVSLAGNNSYLAICMVGRADGAFKESSESKGHFWASKEETRNLIVQNLIFPLNVPMVEQYFNMTN